ncbi:MAG: minor capsid protein [Clostridium septicum]|uniref:minor capsid protein n=1 Tax=Clostridium septicum TaxID=1504 RepID=UPI002587C911|nr:minor capsid protein [Clostridium septicum]MDU1313934.1 minor capsid protein [Clostridium septicum]
MATNVRIKMDDIGKVLLKRYLNKDGQAQEKFTKECAKWMNNYVPYDHGGLKDIRVEIKKDKVIYNSDYAKKQYYTNKGNGKQGENSGGKRAKYWDKRCWIDNGNRIVKSIADFVGGRAK